MGTLACIAIVLSITLTADTQNEDENGFVSEGEPITFEEFITNKFYPKYFNGTWWSSNEIQWSDQSENLVLWNVETQETSELVSSETVGLVSSSASFVAFGQTKSLLLFKDNTERVWRHSFLAQYFVLDASRNETVELTPASQPQGTKLQYAQWVPSTNKIVYVHQNNIFIRDFDDLNKIDQQLTRDGVVDNIYNGIPDWVYEEEILSTNKAMYFTKSGSKIAFARFNDEDVQEFYYSKYGDPQDPYKVQYPKEIMLKYPKVGTANPKINLMVSDLSKEEVVLKPVVPPSEVAEEHIYTAATWVSETELSVIWANRVQNESRFV